MVQFLPTIQEPKSTAGAFLEGLGRAAQTIPELIGAYQQRKQMDALSKDILALDPENRTNQALAKVLGSGLPPEQQLPIFRLLSITDPFKQQQQERLNKDSILNRYSKRIAEIDSAIKGGFGSYEERQQLESQRKRLQAERDQLLGFTALNEPTDDSGIDQGAGVAQPTNQPTSNGSKKVKFDTNNQAHMKKFNQLDKHFKGDADKINAQLAKEFEL